MKSQAKISVQTAFLTSAIQMITKKTKNMAILRTVGSLVRVGVPHHTQINVFKSVFMEDMRKKM